MSAAFVPHARYAAATGRTYRVLSRSGGTAQVEHNSNTKTVTVGGGDASEWFEWDGGVVVRADHAVCGICTKRCAVSDMTQLMLQRSRRNMFTCTACTFGLMPKPRLECKHGKRRGACVLCG